jgi:hypothetical protein
MPCCIRPLFFSQDIPCKATAETKERTNSDPGQSSIAASANTKSTSGSHFGDSDHRVGFIAAGVRLLGNRKKDVAASEKPST